jgi:hypothetical protein
MAKRKAEYKEGPEARENFERLAAFAQYALRAPLSASPYNSPHPRENNATRSYGRATL